MFTERVGIRSRRVAVSQSSFDVSKFPAGNFAKYVTTLSLGIAVAHDAAERAILKRLRQFTLEGMLK